MNRKANGLSVLLLVAFIIILLIIAAAVLSQQQSTSPITLTPTPTPWEGTAQLIANVTSIDWGLLGKGRTYTQAVQLSNIGDATTNDLHMTSDCSIGTFTWDAEGTRINAPNDRRAVTFTLKVNDNAPADKFNFNIKITY